MTTYQTAPYCCVGCRVELLPGGIDGGSIADAAGCCPSSQFWDVPVIVITLQIK